MTQHDVFISYASTDKAIADAIVACLELRGIRCWYAPRDITPGETYGAAIVEAIRGARVMVLVFSSASNRSSQILNEVERAVHHELHVIPFRIDPIEPSGDLEYFVSSRHWLDALPPPAREHIDKLANTLGVVLGPGDAEAAPATAAAAPPEARRSSRGASKSIALLLLVGLIAFATFKMGLWSLGGGEGTNEQSEKATSSISDSKRTGGSDRGSHDQTSDETGERGALGGVGDGENPAKESGESETDDPNPTPEGDRGSEQGGGGAEDSNDDAALLGKQGPFEGKVGGGEPERAEYEFLPPAHGRVRFSLTNLEPIGARNADIAGFSVGANHGYGTGAGQAVSRNWRAVVKGQPVALKVMTHSSHAASFRIDAEFEGLPDFGLAVHEESGVLDRRAPAQVGFDVARADRWTWTAPDHGRVKFTLTNLMPLGTEFASTGGLSVDGRAHYGCGPGDERLVNWFAVRKNQKVGLRIEAIAGNAACYELASTFEELDRHALEVVEEDLALGESAELGQIGFGDPKADFWTYVAPGHGRAQVRFENLMPQATELAGTSGLHVDGRGHHGNGPGERRETLWFTVRESQVVKIKVSAAPNNSVCYRLGTAFEPLSDHQLEFGAGGGELDAMGVGQLGFDGERNDDWTWTAREEGSVRFEISNSIPGGTDLANVGTVSIDGAPSHGCGPGQSRTTGWAKVTKGQTVRIAIDPVQGHCAVYEIRPEFKTD